MTDKLRTMIDFLVEFSPTVTSLIVGVLMLWAIFTTLRK
jgi:hypothetical protein